MQRREVEEVLKKKRKARRKRKSSTGTSIIKRTKVVCAHCREPWRASGSPAICPDCGEASYALVVERR